MTRKVLVSPGFGAGWSTWMENDPEQTLWIVTYLPIIEYLEAGGDANLLLGGTKFSRHPTHPLIAQMECDFTEKFGESAAKSLYFGGAKQLEVQEVEGQFKITDYDGSETLIERDDDDEWL